MGKVLFAHAVHCICQSTLLKPRSTLILAKSLEDSDAINSFVLATSSCPRSPRRAVAFWVLELGLNLCHAAICGDNRRSTSSTVSMRMAAVCVLLFIALTGVSWTCLPRESCDPTYQT